MEANPAPSVPIPFQVDYRKLPAHHEPLAQRLTNTLPIPEHIHIHIHIDIHLHIVRTGLPLFRAIQRLYIYMQIPIIPINSPKKRKLVWAVEGR